MITKTITYEDYDGNPVTDTFCFNLNRAELFRLNMKYDGDFEAHAKKVVASKNTNDIFSLFEELIRLSVGIKSADGKRFVKTADECSAFFDSEAYAEFLYELINNPDSVTAFVDNLVHKPGNANAVANA